MCDTLLTAMDVVLGRANCKKKRHHRKHLTEDRCRLAGVGHFYKTFSSIAFDVENLFLCAFEVGLPKQEVLYL